MKDIQTDTTFIKHENEPFSFREINEILSSNKIKNLVICRNDTIIGEWHEHGHDKVNYIFSCTKSIISALIGIAIEEKLIDSVQQKISDFFPQLKEKTVDSRKKSITIKHLLNMTSGIDWPAFDKLVNVMKSAPDWAEFVLARPMITEPGNAFNYNSGGSHLLSSIISKATGMSAQDYAKKHIFEPLNFSAVKWKDNNGTSMGGSGLHLATRDMAKFGCLYLNKGYWGFKKIISSEWILESTKIQSEGYPNYEPKIFGNYGYHWWISPTALNGECDMYFALGYGGQYIFVIPDYKLVVAFRKALNGKDNSVVPKNILMKYIINNFKNI